MSLTSGTLEIHDTRTSKNYTIQVNDNVVLGDDLAQIAASAIPGRTSKKDCLRVLDPGYANTAVMESNVTYCGDDEDGKPANLEYRGHTFDSLRKSHDFEEVIYLMIWNKLPTIFEKNWLRRELAQACNDVPDSVIGVIQAFPRESPYYTMLMGGLSAWLGANKDFIPAMNAKNLYHGNVKAIDRACIRTLSAYYMVMCASYCHRNGRPFVRNITMDRPIIYSLFLMMGLITETESSRSKTILHSMNQLWIAGCDHEMNNSNSALLHAASTLADPVSCFMSALASSYGILHFGAVESVYTMLQRIGKPENVAVAIATAKATRQRIMGVGHRVYKSRDPRIEPLKGLLILLAGEGMKDPLLDVAYEVERQIHTDPHFVQRKLCVNVDLYWPLSYRAMGIDQDAMLPIFLCSRIVGMMAHWRESMLKPIKLWRPLIVFNGVRAPQEQRDAQETQESHPIPETPYTAEPRKLSWPNQLAISLLNLPGVPKLLTAVS